MSFSVRYETVSRDVPACAWLVPAAVGHAPVSQDRLMQLAFSSTVAGWPDNSDAHTFALVEGARIPRIAEILETDGLEYGSLFQGAALDELAAVAPWIVRLDPEERLRFKNIVSKLEGERTIIISTHIVEDVENLCDELVIINNGTVAAQGTCAEIENAAAGKVYEIEDSRLGELSEPYFIQRQFERDSKRMTAVLSAQAQPTAASVSPRVEDGYICITKNI